MGHRVHVHLTVYIAYDVRLFIGDTTVVILLMQQLYFRVVLHVVVRQSVDSLPSINRYLSHLVFVFQW